jgi:hypothetical protein
VSAVSWSTGTSTLGLNLARSQPSSLANFHDPSPRAQDYKIRHAFFGTPCYGAYMTDLIKGTVMLDSRDLVRHIATRPDLLSESLTILLDELDDLGSAHPTLIAFGNDTHRIAERLIPASRFERLVGVTHYGHYVSKEEYRTRVLRQLSP